MNCVSWDQAQTFCQWAGGRLPTEAEWEFAARSMGRDQVYPWGDEVPSCALAMINDIDINPQGARGCGKDRPDPVCSREIGSSDQGLCDLAGNLWEWVGDWYAPDYYRRSPRQDPRGPSSGQERVRRGGAFAMFGMMARATRRVSADPSQDLEIFGFRCAR